MNETWISIIDNHYSISSIGRIRNNLTGNISFGSNRKGYKSLDFRNKSYYIHRLVAMAFLQNTAMLPVVNHKNGIKTDNRVENLEWTTQYQNIAHAKMMVGYQSMLKNRYKLHETIEILKMFNVYGFTIKEISLIYSRSYFSIRKVLTQTHHLPSAICL